MYWHEVADIIIAETAIREGAVLVSQNCNLRKVAQEFDGDAVDEQTFSNDRLGRGTHDDKYMAATLPKWATTTRPFASTGSISFNRPAMYS